MIYCKELKKEFSTKAEMFKALRESYKDIIADKKAKIYNCEPGENKGAINVIPIDASKINTTIKGFEKDDDYYYIAVNTTRILDSHTDVSIDKSWNKTAKDQQGNVYLIFNHDFDPTKTIVKKEYIEMFVATIPFALLGKSYEGETEALIYKFRKDKVINQFAKDWLDSGDAIEASVRLQYIKILFALNSDEDEDKEFKKNYDKYYSIIANKDDFKCIDYFWAVLEQRNVLESSLVLAASNPVTGQIDNSSKSDNVICQSCSKEFDYLSIKESGMGYVKCPECESVVTQQMKEKPLRDTSKIIDEPSIEDTQKTFYSHL